MRDSFIQGPWKYFHQRRRPLIIHLAGDPRGVPEMDFDGYRNLMIVAEPTVDDVIVRYCANFLAS
ncbi:hypothetical protein ACM0CQ_16750 [Mycobacteroides abscessus subsp. abscessus]|uniref:hypothetical protein n=1 Tax=Mycobacteroides abscessus TaxID=36809 RepID=UPI0039EF9BCD